MAKKLKTPASPIATAIAQGALAPDTAPSAVETAAPSLPVEEPTAAPVIAAEESADPTDVLTAASFEEPSAEPEVAPPSIEETEAAYGLERLADLLKDRDLFLAECKAGLEPAVAEALYALVTNAGGPAMNRSVKAKNVPYLGRSTCKDPVRTVWEIASTMPGASRQEVVTACVHAGVATSTAHTQFQAWRTAGKKSVTGAPIVK